MRYAQDRAPDASQIFTGIDLASRNSLIIAVSGGSDSMALLDLAEQAFGPARLRAVTVDHGLRPEAAGEARFVARHCEARNISHRTLHWAGREAGRGGLIARAREARYRLLADAAVQAGTDLVLLGHTADDQAETVAMRGQRRVAAGGWDRGGSGMARATLFDGRVWFARPLLARPRSALREHLRNADISWIDDPTNDDPRYERARIRAALASTTGGVVADLQEAAREAARQRVEIDAAAARLVAAYASMPSPGLFRIDPAFLESGDREASLHAFRGLLATAGGRDQLPDHGRASLLLSELTRIGLRATLSRTRVDIHRQGIFLTRENRGLPRLACVDEIVWDGRHRLVGFSGAAGLAVAPIGTARAQERAVDTSVAPQAIARAGLLAEPIIERADGVPAGKYPGVEARFERLVSPFARFLGEHDMALAVVLSRLVGEAAPPPSPFARHNAG